MCNSLQNLVFTKSPLVEKTHGIVLIVGLAIDLYVNSWYIYKFQLKTFSDSLSHIFYPLANQSFWCYHYYIHISSNSLFYEAMFDQLHE